MQRIEEEKLKVCAHTITLISGAVLLHHQSLAGYAPDV